MPSTSVAIPGWILAEVLDWMLNARTGELALEFNSGKPQRFRRHETCSPPKDDATPAGLPKWPTQSCPECSSPMAEDHTHEKFKCPDHAMVSIWDLRRRNAFVTHE